MMRKKKKGKEKREEQHYYGEMKMYYEELVPYGVGSLSSLSLSYAGEWKKGRKNGFGMMFSPTLSFWGQVLLLLLFLLLLCVIFMYSCLSSLCLLFLSLSLPL